MSRHEQRVQTLTDELGVDRVLECVGTDRAWSTALGVARDGGTIGYVGVPAGMTAGVDLGQFFGRNTGIGGGVAPVRAYIPQLLPDILEGRIDPSPVFDLTVNIEGIPEGYAAMDERRAIKVLVDNR